MSSTHTVGNFTFTITTPWREGDSATTLTQRHWDNVQDAIETLQGLIGS